MNFIWAILQNIHTAVHEIYRKLTKEIMMRQKILQPIVEISVGQQSAKIAYVESYFLGLFLPL